MGRDLDKLQGVWHITSLEKDGDEVPGEGWSGAEIIVAKTTFTSLGMGAD